MIILHTLQIDDLYLLNLTFFSTVDRYSDEVDVNQSLRRGLWRPRNEIPPEYLTTPSLFIGKRVKIWWDGNQEYFEADVIDYNESTGKHDCRYDVDGTSQAEFLIPDASKSVGNGYDLDWNWLDESQEEFIIKKKV
jgi:hypothetical protein